MFGTYISVMSLVAALDPQCQVLIDANSQTLDLIRTIQVNYTITVGQVGNPRRQVDEVCWSREGRRERIRRVADERVARPTAEGRPQGISDFLIDGDITKHLQNWDPEKPQKITPSRQGTVRARVEPKTNVNAEVLAPSAQLHFEVDFMPRRTLRELAKVSPSVTCKGKVQVDGHDLYLISLETPEETTKTTSKKYFDVYLDPQAGYMIRKIVVNASAMLADGKIIKDAHAHEVLEFKDFGDGVFVPTRIRHGSLDKWVSELVVKSLKVNESISPETFEMEWPKYVAVAYYPPIQGKAKVEIWGDGKPLREISSLGDAQALETELRKDPRIAAELGPVTGAPPPPPMSTLVKLFIAFGALLAVMIALVLRRRMREQAAA